MPRCHPRSFARGQCCKHERQKGERLQSGGGRWRKSAMAHMWEDWLHNPRRLQFPDASKQGTKSEVAHKWADWLNNPCRPRGGGGTKSVLAHQWVDWLHNPYRRGRVGGGGGAQCFKARSKIRIGPTASKHGTKSESHPQVRGLATQPLPFGVSPTLQSTGQNQKWPTTGQIGYITRNI